MFLHIAFESSVFENQVEIVDASTSKKLTKFIFGVRTKFVKWVKVMIKVVPFNKNYTQVIFKVISKANCKPLVIIETVTDNKHLKSTT